MSTTIPISPRASAIALPALRASSTRQLLAVLGERVGERVQQSRARAPGASARHAGQRRRRARATASSTSLDAARGDLREHRLGGGLED